ncbi:hypothetical protein [Novosphingobium sp. 9U]|uniref:hypothetical protein n=1 Tax=Novosphingobium sp. 9U TaxID=2653158 RepID=UPI0012F0266D|nr:hypothetical protein [Novosphingobium sp. 9U]VWX51791.1 hypothetical protein NOVOSPHI9U_40394 [Novosphingobium sp. 9U]
MAGAFLNTFIMINSRFSLSGDATLFAGEAFSAELAFADGDEHPIALTGRTFALTIFRKHDRTVVHSTAGAVIEGADPHVLFTISGTTTETLYAQADKALRLEMAEILPNGKDVWVAGNLRVLASAGPISMTDADGAPASTDRLTVLPTRRVIVSNRAPPPFLDFAAVEDVETGTSADKIVTPASLAPIHSAIINLATQLIRTQTITARNLPAHGPE